MGVKRKDREAFYYGKRCKKCAYKSHDPEIYAKKVALLNKAREKQTKPIGSRRLHEASKGVFYWVIKVSEKGKWQYEHRAVTNCPKGYHVHHKNENTLDNRLENLEIISASDHQSLHHQIIGKWSKKYDCCIICQTTARRHLSFGQCTACYQRLKYIPSSAAI